VICHCTGSWK